MKISAHLKSSRGSLETELRTDDRSRSIALPTKPDGYGSGVNGGELLFLALAACYCNDIFREAVKKEIRVHSVDVTVQGDFGAEGEPARNVSYDVRVEADAPESAIRDLALHTDGAAEIQNTVRVAIPVLLTTIQAVSR